MIRSSQTARTIEALLLGVPGLGAAAALYGLPVLLIARNRLLPGAPQEVLGAATHGIAALAVGAVLLGLRPGRAVWAALLAALAALAWLVAGLGEGAARVLAGQPPSARAFLGSGAWVAGTALAILAVGIARRVRGGGLLVALTGLIGVGAALAGSFDALSLAVEYRARAEAVNAAFLAHLGLAGAGLGLALLVALPLGLVAFRDGRAGALVDALLAGVQVVPVLALFGALVSLLSLLLRNVSQLRDLGLAAIGPVPAVVGIAAYLALPLVRSLVAGLRSPEPAVIESARAMGLTEAGILTRVRVPLGAPLLVGGLRVAAVQAVGLATLGGLVGAGGLGAVVFEGMAQFAPDLILIGAAPVVALSVAVDQALRAAGALPAIAGGA